MADEYDDLSGTELRQRLERHGCPPEVAETLAHDRDRGGNEGRRARAAIASTLGPR